MWGCREADGNGGRATICGVWSAGAQAPGNPVVAIADNGFTVFTANGDIYWSGGSAPHAPGTLYTMANNVFSGMTPTQRESFGAMKSRYRGSAQPQDR